MPDRHVVTYEQVEGGFLLTAEALEDIEVRVSGLEFAADHMRDMIAAKLDVPTTEVVVIIDPPVQPSQTSQTDVAAAIEAQAQALQSIATSKET